MKKQRFHRVLAALLASLMMLACLPFSLLAFAAEETVTPDAPEELGALSSHLHASVQTKDNTVGLTVNVHKVCGNLTEERFKKMTEAYEAEQATLTERVKVLRRELATAKEETEGVDKFLRIVRKYTEIAELTPETVREFIDRIIVHEAEKTDGKKRQIVEIYYNCVGVIPNPA